VSEGDERPQPPFVGDERTLLTGFLDFHRATLAWKCAGLTPDQLARRSLPPSSMSLLGLVRHLAEVERAWFDRVAGADRSLQYSSPQDRDRDFDGAVGGPDAAAESFYAWRAAVGEARMVTARTDLDATFEHPRDGTTSLRWVLIHLIEEYARHNGHADLLREVLDGSTGE
jgi:uncharacterized damage-inducible protein DinB